MVECTIIIATYNEENFIEECIRSLENQTYSKDKYQIYIIDGESKDNTTKVVEKLMTEYSNIKLFNNPKKIQAVAFNIGLNNSETDYCFVVGAHATFDKEFIENSVISIKENDAVCVGGKVTFDAKTKIGQYYALARGTLFGGGTASYRYSDKKQYVDTASFGCYKTESMKNVGGYNEELVKNQDNDINKRIRAQGGKMLFDPSIKFTYFTRDNYKDIKKQMFNYGYWESKVIKQDPKQFSIITMVPVAFVIYNIIAILLAVKTIVPLLLCYVPYLLIYTMFYFKHAAGKNPIKLLWIYLTIHTSIGIGLIKGCFTK
ncbi:glycosyltransferase family 2 protein [Clostridium gasigenes]|uniref:glycosyltransferase family 2 protein n=1 Tax=Clostridium gasigenes TaxID=94869 RepID=UPI0014385BAE|nr:glycosyltransferase family 2 protein [Clostridium gasigenes]NKF08486.1 glycosyltransferase family 2 protein [Clostridium gasigenes]QSW21301.1 glycosyltransferase family 2 protein [Clostridium gasigenes]